MRDAPTNWSDLQTLINQSTQNSDNDTQPQTTTATITAGQVERCSPSTATRHPPTIHLQKLCHAAPGNVACAVNNSRAVLLVGLNRINGTYSDHLPKSMHGVCPKALVPELHLKKKKRNISLAKSIRTAKAKETKLRAKNRREIVKRAAKYAKEYEHIERTDIYIPEEPKLIFVIRIRGINGVSPKVRKILQLFRLLQINNGVFLRVNKPILKMLNEVQHYVAYGYPNLKTVKELVLKRGYGKVNGQRIPISSNDVIEKQLGRLGIICVEDLVHEIFTVGPNFKKANNFLWPFKLNTPNGGWVKKGNHYVEGGDYGNREDAINKLVRRMN
eukprot:gene33-3429_t